MEIVNTGSKHAAGEVQRAVFVQIFHQAHKRGVGGEQKKRERGSDGGFS